MKKVLLIARSFPPKISGGSTNVGNLFRHLPREDYCVLTLAGFPEDPASAVDCTMHSCRAIFANSVMLKYIYEYVLIGGK